MKKLTAYGCTFENLCALQASQYGGGIGMDAPGVSRGIHCDMEITGCTFRNNEMNTGAGTYGGALYVGADVKCTVRDSVFEGNRANTGGAAAVYKGLLDIDGSNRFSGNEASQRGGTIHDAGTAILKDLDARNFQGDGCGQFGGAVTVISVSYTHLDVYKRQVRAVTASVRKLRWCCAKESRSRKMPGTISDFWREKRWNVCRRQISPDMRKRRSAERQMCPI